MRKGEQPARARMAWAIVDRRGNIQLDMVMSSRAEAWGLALDNAAGCLSVEECKANGYRCIRVEIKPAARH